MIAWRYGYVACLIAGRKTQALAARLLYGDSSAAERFQRDLCCWELEKGSKRSHRLLCARNRTLTSWSKGRILNAVSLEEIAIGPAHFLSEAVF